MSAVLGVSAYYHDAAAALVIDGRIVAAQQEERLSRIKNDASLPLRAIAAVLELGGIEAADLDAVVFYENPYAKLERVLVGALEAFPKALRQFPRALGTQLGHKIWIVDALAETIGIDRKRVELVRHHESHAASAFYPSPFASAAVVVVDAVGEDACTTIWRASVSGLREVARIDYPQSLGLFYAAMTAYLGFPVNDGEYKVMGLAPYGTPSLREHLARVVALRGDGSYVLDLDYFDRFTGTELGFGAKLERLLGPSRPLGKRWDFDDPEDRRFADVAFASQSLLEEAMLGITCEARKRTGEHHLCLAGGVALNAVANRRIAREAGFDQVFVQPAAGDAGGALGAALLGASRRGAERCLPMTHAALGVEVSAEHVHTHTQALGLHAVRVSDPVTTIAEALSRDEVVAWVHGRCEWGPRALGQRSILARPTDIQTRERLNRAIKKREPFRPFAPVVRASAMAQWFDGEPDLMTPFMTTVADVRDRDALQAVTHVDGTARVQTVDDDSEMGRLLAHHPVLLNTSLNGPGEPIVATLTDALSFFVRHGVDRMVIDDVEITRPA